MLEVESVMGEDDALGAVLKEFQTFFLFKNGLGFGSDASGNDDFQEDFVHLFCKFRVDHTVHTDHPAKGRDRVAFQRLFVGFGQVISDGKAARIAVLDDTDGVFICECRGDLDPAVEIIEVVETCLAF